jgi:hypothetical protein
VTYTYTDGNGCDAFQTVSVTIFPEPVVTLNDPADVCIDGADMSFTASPVGGVFTTTAPAGFTSNGAAGTASLDVSAAGVGTYTVTYTYTDGNGCDAFQTVSVTIFALPSVASTTVSNPTSCVINDGAIDITASGGSGFYTYDWLDLPGTSDPEDRTGLSSGTYTVVVTDANNCTASTSITLIGECVAIGNYVFMDVNGNGMYNAGVDMPLAGVTVELYAAGADYGVDAPLFTTTTDVDGYYYFDQLTAGQYVVYIPAGNFAPGGILENKESSPGADNTDTVDNNDNGGDTPVNGGIASNVIDLQPNAEPTGEDQANYPGTLDDNNVNGTVDFSFSTEKVAIGNYVFMDVNDNGTFETGTDMPISGVAVELYTAAQTPGVDVPVGTTSTNGNGYYYFDELTAGQYVVFIPSVNFTAGQPLENKQSYPGADATQTADGNDNGIDAPLNGGIASNVITLTPNSQPTGEDQTDYPGTLDDNNVNGTIDFTFRTEKVAVGNYVFMDVNDNGTFESGTDMALAGVTVQLFAAGAIPGTDAPLFTTTTNTNGYYYFDNLNAGQYFVHIPASNFGAGQPLENKESYPGADNTDTADGNDNGSDTPVAGGTSSNTFTLTPNSEPTGEDQTDYPGALDDNNVNGTIDFTFRTEKVAVGNYVFMDMNDNGTFESGTDMALAGVTVQLFAAGAIPGTDAPLFTTTTNTNGYYYFDNLNAGQYFVHIPASNFGAGQPLENKESYPGADNTDTADGNDNGSDTPVAGGTSSNTFTLTPNSEPTGEDQTDYPGALDDNNVNGTIDFTFRTEKVAVGNYVFMDVNDNGTFESGTDMALAGVTVQLFAAGAIPGTDAPLFTTTTNTNGYYYFDNLNAGQYFVHIPASNFGAGQPLENKESYPGADNTDTADGNDNGSDTPVAGGTSSNTFTLTPNSEPTGEDQTDYPGALDDNNVNGTIDFGFRVEKVAVGNFVFMDNDDSGTFNAGDMAIPSVTVQLYAAGANYGVDAPLFTAITDPSGYYYFDNLNAGDYVVFIPSLNFNAGGALVNKESVPGAQTNDTDNDDNGQDTPVNGGIRSNPFTLTPNALPTNESGAGGSGTGTPAYTGGLDDNNVNETIDFGFRVEKVAVGNYVFMDNDDSGTFNAGDMAIPNVTVQLYAAGGNYGVDAPLLTDVTDPSGYYYFDELNAGDYVVYIPSLNFNAGGALVNKESVPGAQTGNTDNDDNGQDTKVNGGIRSNMFTLTPNALPTNESGAGGSGSGTPAYTGLLDDNNVNETIDFGFRVEKVAVGNFVFMDMNNDGIYNFGDMPVPLVTVWLYPASANYGIDLPLATDVTDPSGYYYFDQLNAGDYVVYIPASNFLLGAPLDSKESSPGANTDNTDNDDNGQDAPVNGGIRSNVFTLTPNAMPTNESGAGGSGTGTPAYPGLLDDNNVNETIDFSFRCVNPLPDIIADITVNTDPGVCTAVVTYNVTIVTTPSNNLTVTHEFSGATTGSGNGTGSGSTFNLGETTVTITAMNACTTVVRVFTITVEDKELPVITCPPNVTVQCMPMNQNATATDNCSVASVELLSMVYLDPPMMCVSGRRLVRTFIATDGSGNTATCTHQITLVDNIAPTFTFVPANVTVQCNSVPNPGTPIATDNCAGQVTMTYNGQTKTNGACTDSYVLVRQWTASDACGNTRTATQRINVIDSQKPAFLNPPANITVQCDAIPNPATPVATDNCDGNVAITYVGQTRTNGTCTNRYTLTRRWVASDNCNNTISISQRISVVDNGKPVFTSVPGNVTLNCTDAIPAVGVPTASDGCGGPVTVVYLGAWNMNATCPGNYQIMRSWKATDACGNSTSAAQIITIQDNTAPTFTSFPGNVTIQCSQAPPAVSNPVATDGCGGYVQISYLGQVRTNGNCQNNYTLTRTWRATDLCGNATIRAQVITVQDTQAPNFTGNLPASTTVVCAPNCVPLAPTLTATDNCGSATVTMQQTQTAGDCSSGYTVTRTWTATDQCGNAKQHTQTYTVLPTPFAQMQDRTDEQNQLETSNPKLKTVTLLPNPTADWVSIGLSDFAGETVVVSIHNELGQLIWEQRIPTVEESLLRVNLRQAGAAAGLHTVSVRASGQVYTKRLILMD